MDDPQPHYAGPQPDESRAPWLPIGVGAALVVLAIAGVVIFSRSQAPPAGAGAHPYAAYLKFAGLKMSAAENFVGGNVTYLDAQLTNHGDRTVNGVTLELVFRNALDEAVQKESMRVMALSRAGPYPDIADLRSAPLKPGETREVRLTLEHISADWNQQYPEIKVTGVSFQ